ncbi:serine protease [Tropicimonas sp. IMCC34011]|uniref:trypsin-like serine peptidase n=1 Tax=Tropicimonas sp. IMCC34011 TaxID=2248759 RepID=UPI000E22DB6E|nr:trypsin-like peptidase domain-containing protein [Tropicimonas sp. IMCC34011]
MLRVLVACLFLAGQAVSADTTLRELATADDGKGWEAVGRIDLGGKGSFCTGALIAADLVLTAAHCLFDSRSGARIPDGEIEFMAGLRNGRAEAYRGVRRSTVPKDYDYLDKGSIHRVSRDIALLLLDQPIQLPSIRPFPPAMGLTIGTEVGVVSYAAGREAAPSLQEVCEVLDAAGGVAMLSCAVDFGASGAPVFVLGPGGPQVAFVVSAKAESDGRKVALASDLGATLHGLKRSIEINPTGAMNAGSAFVTGAKRIRP